MNVKVFVRSKSRAPEAAEEAETTTREMVCQTDPDDFGSDHFGSEPSQDDESDHEEDE